LILTNSRWIVAAGYSPLPTFPRLYSDSQKTWSWSYGCSIYNYLCNQCLSPLKVWGRIPLRRGLLNTTLCDKVCQWLTAGQWFSPISYEFSSKLKLWHNINISCDTESIAQKKTNNVKNGKLIKYIQAQWLYFFFKSQYIHTFTSSKDSNCILSCYLVTNIHISDSSLVNIKCTYCLSDNF
jgi:hypothetical protein